METAIELTTSAPRAEMAKLLETAEQMCFVLNAVREPHTVRRRATVNGEPLVSGGAESASPRSGQA